MVCRALITGLLVYLAMSGADAPAQMQSLGAGQATPKSLCLALRNVMIPASEIGLPTGGAALVCEADASSTGRVWQGFGGIAPVDPEARDIRFEVNPQPRGTERLSSSVARSSMAGCITATA